MEEVIHQLNVSSSCGPIDYASVEDAVLNDHVTLDGDVVIYDLFAGQVKGEVSHCSGSLL